MRRTKEFIDICPACLKLMMGCSLSEACDFLKSKQAIWDSEETGEDYFSASYNNNSPSFELIFIHKDEFIKMFGVELARKIAGWPIDIGTKG
jgi:hypothetical protein